MLIIPSKFFIQLGIDKRKAILINAIISTTAMLGFVLLKGNFPFFSCCVFQSLLNFPCPGCGITTGLYYILSGHILMALKINFAAAMIFICQAGIFLTAIAQFFNFLLTSTAMLNCLRIAETLIVTSIAISYLITIINKTLHLWPM